MHATQSVKAVRTNETKQKQNVFIPAKTKR